MQKKSLPKRAIASLPGLYYFRCLQGFEQVFFVTIGDGRTSPRCSPGLVGEIRNSEAALVILIQRRRERQNRHALLDQGAGIFIFRPAVDRTLRDEAVLNFARFLDKTRAHVLGRFEDALAKSIDHCPHFEVMLVEKIDRSLGICVRDGWSGLLAASARERRRHNRFANFCRPAMQASDEASFHLRVKNRAALKPALKFMAAHATQGI